MKTQKLKPADTAPLPPLQLPAGPYVKRDGQTPVITDAGSKAIEMMAAEAFTQGKIAATLGVSAHTFKTMMRKQDDDPPSPARAAWESGRAAFESEIARLLLASARRGNTIAQLFTGKVQFSWRDQGPATIVEGPRINFLMPGGYTEEQYLAKLGISAPIDARPAQMRGLTPYESMGLLPPTPTTSPTPQGETQHADQSEA